MHSKIFEKPLRTAKLALLVMIAFGAADANAMPYCPGPGAGGDPPACGGPDLPEDDDPCGPRGCDTAPDPDPVPSTVATPTATPEPEQTWPGISTGDFSDVPPNLSGHLNTVDGEREIQNAIDLFGADGLIANGLAATADSGGNLNGGANGNGNSNGNGPAGNGATTLAASETEKDGGSGIPGTTLGGGNGGNPIGGGFSADVSVNAAEAEDAKNKDASNYAMYGSGSGNFDAGGSGGGSGGSGLAALGGTGEVGADGPAGATRGRNLAGANGDEYLSRAGKLSLFEIINRRYEIWGSQIMRQ